MLRSLARRLEIALSTSRLVRSKADRLQDYVHHLRTQWGFIRYLDTGTQGRPVILLVPDGPCVLEHFLQVVDALQSSLRVLCFELPGFGFSFPSWKYDYSVQSASSLTIELLDRLDIEKAMLGFSCANGYIALDAAKRFPDRILNLILCQTPSIAAMKDWGTRNLPASLSIPIFGQLVNAFFAEKMTRIWLHKAMPAGSVKTRDFIAIAEDALRNGAKFRLASFTQGLAGLRESDISGVDAPTLQIVGLRDRSHLRTNFGELSKHVRRLKRVDFQECGHFPELEQPERFRDAVLQSLSATED